MSAAPPEETAVTAWDLRLIVAPGLEEILRDELVELGLDAAGFATDRGGVACTVDAAGLRRVVERSRIVESVRVLIAREPAAGPAELERRLRRIPWRVWLAPDRPVRVDVSCQRSRIYHSGLVDERLRRTVDAAMGPRTWTREVDDDPARLWLRLDRDVLEVRVEAGTARLHRRGWRQEPGRAPLRESMAAGLLRAAGLPGDAPLLADPFCGSGTLLIEAADIVAGGPPRRLGRAGLDAFAALRSGEQPDASTARGDVARESGALQLLGGDRDPSQLAAARSNAAAAGMAERIELRTTDAAALLRALPAGSAVISNIPFGLRTDDDGVRSLRAVAMVLRERRDLGPIYLLDGGLAAKAGLTGRTVLRLDHGGLAVQLIEVGARAGEGRLGRPPGQPLGRRRPPNRKR